MALPWIRALSPRGPARRLVDLRRWCEHTHVALVRGGSRPLLGPPPLKLWARAVPASVRVFGQRACPVCRVGCWLCLRLSRLRESLHPAVGHRRSAVTPLWAALLPGAEDCPVFVAGRSLLTSDGFPVPSEAALSVFLPSPGDPPSPPSRAWPLPVWLATGPAGQAGPPLSVSRRHFRPRTQAAESS